MLNVILLFAAVFVALGVLFALLIKFRSKINPTLFVWLIIPLGVFEVNLLIVTLMLLMFL
ncbi:MAG: hypothetical protein J6033_04405 [Lachnospiraceae bacterium]|nr:hypothetical protein [Lachnospiraceae bacterium]